MRNAAIAALLFVAVAAPLHAQSGPQAPPLARTLSLSGPRFGLTLLSDGVVKKLNEQSVDVNASISQFGWQFEKQFYTKDSGITALNEWVFLLGGMDQGVAIPSLSWLVGFRTMEGAEFGFGPNFTPAGPALAIAAGITMKTGVINVPMNFAVVPTKAGTRVTMLTGFTLRR